MTKEELLNELRQHGYKEIIDIINKAEKGHIEELEIVEQIGLLRDEQLNEQVINLLKSLGVEIVYITYDDEEDE